MIDLRLLKAFIAVAETENVGRAAERLHISQSPLSRQIMQLEEQLGLTLFERVRQRVRLTDEGRLFLADAIALLARAEDVEATARRLAHGESGTLAIGYVEAAMHCGLLPSALARFRGSHNEVTIDLKAAGSAAQASALERREIDLGLVYTPPDALGIVAHEVLVEPLVVALPAGHPLAHKLDILPADLDGQPWIAMRRDRNPSRDRFLAACHRSGFSPAIGVEAQDLLAMLALVAAGLGLAMVQASLRNVFQSGVVYRDVAWFPLDVRLYTLWRQGDPKPLVAAFRQLLRPLRQSGAAGNAR